MRLSHLEMPDSCYWCRLSKIFKQTKYEYCKIKCDNIIQQIGKCFTQIQRVST